MDKHGSFDLKAVAAAKLVMQELDPLAKQKRQNFMNGTAQALLGIHAKSLRNFSKTFFFTCAFVGNAEIRLILKISIQGTVKCSKIVHIRTDGTRPKSKGSLHRGSKLWSRKSLTTGEKLRSGASFASINLHGDSLSYAAIELVLDGMKMFSVDVSQTYDDPGNFIKFELIEVDGLTGHMRKGMQSVGTATIHLYDLIRDEMYGSKVVPITLKDKLIADVEIEYVFRYGAFGYGYSHQLKQIDQKLSYVLGESMFFRIPAPQQRKDDDGFLEAYNAPRPSYIPFVENTEHKPSSPTPIPTPIPSSDSLYMHNFATNSVMDLIGNRKRLERMRKEYLGLTTRHDRIQYLEALFPKHGVTTAEVTPSIHEDEYDDTSSVDFEKRVPRQLAGMALDIRRPSQAARAVVENVSPLLKMAPGICNRRERNSGLQRQVNRLIKQEPGTDDDEEESGNSENDRDSLADDVDAAKQHAKQGFMKALAKKVFLPIKVTTTWKQMMAKSTEAKSKLAAQAATPAQGNQFSAISNGLQEQPGKARHSSTSNSFPSAKPQKRSTKGLDNFSSEETPV